MPRDYEQTKLDCAVLQQAITDLRAWNAPLPLPEKGAGGDENTVNVGPRAKQALNPRWPRSDTFIAFHDAARWIFHGAGRRPWHFSLQAICCRLELDTGKVRDAIRVKLTPHQRAWIKALRIKGGSDSGRS